MDLSHWLYMIKTVHNLQMVYLSGGDGSCLDLGESVALQAGYRLRQTSIWKK